MTLMGDVLEFKRKDRVRFFGESVVCDHCERDTQGVVFEESQRIICHVCHGVLLEITDEPMFFVTFEEDDFDGSA